MGRGERGRGGGIGWGRGMEWYGMDGGGANDLVLVWGRWG
tara:strand:+ start:165 stop:284 length:120 start_codon:yes stop_codon:yes gene_type:complete